MSQIKKVYYFNIFFSHNSKFASLTNNYALINASPVHVDPRQIIGNIIGVGPTLLSYGRKLDVMISGCGGATWKVMMEHDADHEQGSVAQNVKEKGVECAKLWSEEEGVLRRESRNLLKGEESKGVKCCWVLLRFLLCVEGMFQVFILHCWVLFIFFFFFFCVCAWISDWEKMHYLFWGFSDLSEKFGIFLVYVAAVVWNLKSFFFFVLWGWNLSS